MTYGDYHILEYCRSELQSEGTPFIIVLYFDTKEPHPLRALVMKNWESVVPRGSEAEICFIREFLDDLRHYSQTGLEASRVFFVNLERLDVGPIRTFASGMCTLDDLDALCFTYLGIPENSWQDAMEWVGYH